MSVAVTPAADRYQARQPTRYRRLAPPSDRRIEGDRFELHGLGGAEGCICAKIERFRSDGIMGPITIGATTIAVFADTNISPLPTLKSA